MASTETQTARHGVVGTRPRIGLLGIMQALYDDMLPGITERQAAYAAEVAAVLGDDADVTVAPPVKTREDADHALRELEAADLDGVLVVMLTYGPAMHVARALAGTSLPVCLANIQPVAAVTPAWDMGDLTYNQGIHGAQDTANAMVRAGRPFAVVTEDWREEAFRSRGRQLGTRGGGRDALADAEGRRLRLRDERHGRHPVRRARAAARARPAGRLRRHRRLAPGVRGGCRRRRRAR